MTKHFRSRARAEADLFAHGFRPFRVGKWIKTGFVASIHPKPGSMVVQVTITKV